MTNMLTLQRLLTKVLNLFFQPEDPAGLRPWRELLSVLALAAACGWIVIMA